MRHSKRNHHHFGVISVVKRQIDKQREIVQLHKTNQQFVRVIERIRDRKVLICTVSYVGYNQPKMAGSSHASIKFGNVWQVTALRNNRSASKIISLTSFNFFFSDGLNLKYSKYWIVCNLHQRTFVASTYLAKKIRYDVQGSSLETLL